MLGCGARTGLDVETPDASTLMSGRGSGDGSGRSGGGSVGSGAPAACPPCPPDPTCPGRPYACLKSDGCTYRWCTSSSGLFGDSSVCQPEYTLFGFCVANTEYYLCANPMDNPEGPDPTNCVWPPRGDLPGDPPGNACIGLLKGGQTCGHVSCGAGCTCLCENVCWCGG